MTLTRRRTFLQTAGALVALAWSPRTSFASNLAKQPLDPSVARKPKPICTGPSQAEGIAAFTTRASDSDLTAVDRECLKIGLLDSLGCAIAAVGVGPVEACRAQAQDFGGGANPCTLIGGGKANAIYAAFCNTAHVRFVDFMDSYLGKTGLWHPSDSIGAVLAASQYADRSGQDLLLSLAVAYEVGSRLTTAVPFMACGFDLTTQLTFAIGAGASKALRLDEARMAAAVEICVDSGIPLLVVRTTPIAQWKGLLSSQVALNCMNGVFMAARGITGPKYVVEGPNGLAHALGMPVEVDWSQRGFHTLQRLVFKSYNSALPTQSSIYCMIELCKKYRLDPSQIESVDVRVVKDAYEFTGGGQFGPKWDIHTSEDADHSLPYLVAVAALDGDVQPAQIAASRVEKADVQTLLRKVKVRPDAAYTARYPDEAGAGMTVRMKDGKTYSHAVKDFRGFPSQPFTWHHAAEKFDKLTAGRASASLLNEIKQAVMTVESIQVADLMGLLGRVGNT